MIIDVTFPAAVRIVTSDTTLSETIFSIVPASRFRMLVLTPGLFPQLAQRCQLNRDDDNDGDDSGDKSDDRYTYSLGERNNMHMDSRHTDSSERTDADNTRRDNSLSTSDKRSSRSEIQN